MEYKPASSGLNSNSLQKNDLIGLLSIGFYTLLTLLPDSSSLLVSWPWVFIWQIALMLPWFWLIKSGWTSQTIKKLGFGLDYGVALAILSLLGSVLFAQFQQQAIWYGWAIASSIAAIYALNTWCIDNSRRLKLLKIQAVLSVVFISSSLWLWTTKTLLPELNRLKDLNATGLNLNYDFSVLELRNWAPIGHQNYVAGFLVLSLPLLFCLSIIAKKVAVKFLWSLSFGLGLVALYTTSSRGGWLGLSLAGCLGIIALFSNKKVSTPVRSLIFLSVVISISFILITNNRFRLIFSGSYFNGGGETAYRLITNFTGWAMGSDHPLFGAGAGSVPLLYQKYRPTWAGQEAEFAYQLHSTPAQIWAEFGTIGICLYLGLMGWVAYWGYKLLRSPQLLGENRIICWSLLASLIGYAFVCLTDYQLDIIPIVGSIVIYGVCILSFLEEIIPIENSLTLSQTKKISLGCIGLIIALGIWLIQPLQAWQASSAGFKALQGKNVTTFIANLEKANKLAPWEPYYLYQLGWNIGNNGLSKNEQTSNKEALLKQSQSYLEKSIKISPYIEFGHSSLGWVQFFSQDTQAVKSFVAASKIIPGRKLVFQGIGLALLQQGKVEEAIEAFALELLRNPIEITSPTWRKVPLSSIASPVQDRLIVLYRQLLKDNDQPIFQSQLHQGLGGVYWWQGNFAEAEVEWRQCRHQFGLDILDISQDQLTSTQVPIFKAWLEEEKRVQWIEKAFLIEMKEHPKKEFVQATLDGMNRAKSFDQWVKQHALLADHWRERSGFGVLIRHIDGPAPLDFSTVSENLTVHWFLSSLFPENKYAPYLDRALQPLKEDLWLRIS